MYCESGGATVPAPECARDLRRLANYCIAENSRAHLRCVLHQGELRFGRRCSQSMHFLNGGLGIVIIANGPGRLFAAARRIDVNSTWPCSSRCRQEGGPDMFGRR